MTVQHRVTGSVPLPGHHGPGVTFRLPGFNAELLHLLTYVGLIYDVVDVWTVSSPTFDKGYSVRLHYCVRK